MVHLLLHAFSRWYEPINQKEKKKAEHNGLDSRSPMKAIWPGKCYLVKCVDGPK